MRAYRAIGPRLAGLSLLMQGLASAAGSPVGAWKSAPEQPTVKQLVGRARARQLMTFSELSRIDGENHLDQTNLSGTSSSAPATLAGPETVRKVDVHDFKATHSHDHIAKPPVPMGETAHSHDAHDHVAHGHADVAKPPVPMGETAHSHDAHDHVAHGHAVTEHEARAYLARNLTTAAREHWIKNHHPPPSQPPSPLAPGRYLTSMPGWDPVPTKCARAQALPSSKPHATDAQCPPVHSCSAPYGLKKKMSKSAQCVPDGDSHAGELVATWREMPVGWYGCYPGQNKIYVQYHCSGLFRCENGQQVACGSSGNSGRTDCDCPVA